MQGATRLGFGRSKGVKLETRGDGPHLAVEQAKCCWVFRSELICSLWHYPISLKPAHEDSWHSEVRNASGCSEVASDDLRRLDLRGCAGDSSEKRALRPADDRWPRLQNSRSWNWQQMVAGTGRVTVLASKPAFTCSRSRISAQTSANGSGLVRHPPRSNSLGT
jgi:hypothetical protein